jgi:hypothetical protein
MLSNVKGLKSKKKPPGFGGGFRGFSALFAFKPLDRRWSVRRKNKQSKNARKPWALM